MTVNNDKIALAKRFLQLGREERTKFIRLLDSKGLNFEKLPIVAGDHPKLIPLSPAQKRLWDIYQLDTENSAYHMGGCFEVIGPLDIERLEQALRQVMEKHHTLRTRFIQDEAGDHFQFVEASPAWQIEQRYLQQEDAQTIQQACADFLNQAFDLYRGLPIRALSLNIKEKRHVLQIVLHHIICDGWSIDIFLKELIHAYQGHPLSPPDIQYADYAIWQTALLDAGKGQQHLDFWRHEIGTYQPEKLFQWHQEVALNQRRLADSLEWQLDPQQHRQIKQLARQLSVTTSTLWLGLWQSALAKGAKREDISIGMPLANRQRAEVTDLIGFFVNTLVIKQTISSHHTLLETVQNAHQKVLQAQDHQLLPFDQLVAELLEQNVAGETPFFQVLFNHQMMAQPQVKLTQDVTIEAIAQAGQFALFDVALDIREQADTSRVVLTYAKDRILATQMTQLFELLKGMTDSLADQLNQPLANIQLINASDRQRLQRLSQPQGQWQFSPITQLISEQVQQRPDAIAIKQGQQQYSFAELEATANQLAHHLRSLGIKRDEPIGVLFERRCEMIIAMLAIMKAGGAFLPLDPDYPTERLAYMLEDSRTKRLLFHHNIASRWQEIQSSLPKDSIHGMAFEELNLGQYEITAPNLILLPKQLAYIIYTSGSTGKPKGVAIPHDGLSMHVQTIGKQYGMTCEDVELHFASISFDGAVERWTVPLAFGTKLIIRDQALWSAEKTCRLLEQEKVTIACFPPSYVAPLLDWIEATQTKLNVRSWTLGGEAFTKETFDRLQSVVKPPRIINGYGPTETVVTPLIWRAYPETSLHSAYAPIGEAVGSRRLYVLDDELNPVPVGAQGELYIGDEAGLARGYLYQAQQTSERFLPDPFQQNGERMYRTGDLVRWNDNGIMEYLGRIDQQVKIRGFRIELGEIENRLQQVSGAETCLVCVYQQGKQDQLIGYLHSQQRLTFEHSSILAQLAEQVPEYMVPTQLITLSQLPLTPAGKIDRKALPAPAPVISTHTYEAPNTPQETLLAEIWQALLGSEKVGRHDHFFALGGDSILCLQLVSKLKLTGFSITPKTIFNKPILRDLAHDLKRVQAAKERPLPQAPFDLMPIQAHFMAQDFAEPNHWNQHLCVALKQTMDYHALAAALNALVEHHPSLRLAFSDHTGHWQQSYQDTPNHLLWQTQVQDEVEFDEFALRLQTSLDIRQGRLLQAGLVAMPDQTQRLILVIHHLAVDGVAWRVLLDDLWTTYQQATSGQPLSLPPNYASLDMAIEQLNEWRTSNYCQQKQAHWQSLIEASHHLHPEVQPALYRDKKSVSMHLNEQQTAALLTSRRDITSSLLAALPVSSLCSNEQGLTLYLEGHGREESVFGDLDLSRLVGWMTSLYPVMIQAGQDASSIEEELKRLREDGGISFGVRYLAPNPPNVNALLTFNYLGQYADQDFAHWCQPIDSGGPAQSELNTMLTPLVINAQVVSGRLTASWEFATSHFTESQVKDFAEQWRDQLSQHLSLEEGNSLSRKTIKGDGNLIEKLNNSHQRPIFCLHPVTGRVVGYQKLASALEGQRAVYGIQSQSFVYTNQFDTSFSHMADVYLASIKTIQPTGPYTLVGWSLGGALCQEIAARLEQAGEEIEFIGLLDCYVPGTEIAEDQWQSDQAKQKLIMHLELLLGTLSQQQAESCLIGFDQRSPQQWPDFFDTWLKANHFAKPDADNARQLLYSWAVEQHMRALCAGYQLPKIQSHLHSFWAGQPKDRANWLMTELSKINTLVTSQNYETDHLGIVQHAKVITDLSNLLCANTLVKTSS
ncbi:amino acid adenylation domain-containing protein [Marinomonas sp. THO17]|uniref:non-ribosomal peptide synthetase n=1 Tax=Marinomonas sp. THO17 TaxID=3149048 RepID=UPI00336BD195